MQMFKKISVLAVALTLIVAVLPMSADTKKAEIKVSGNCNACKKRTEKSLKDADGVQSAVWDKTTKILTVDFEATKTDANKIQALVAKTGHDTELTKSTAESYSKLPKCCKYRDGNGGH